MLLKRLILLYFLLLLFEGALRKWFLPGLATPLLVVRDPVVLAIYFLAFKQRLFPLNNWIIGAAGMATMAGLLAMTVGHQSVFVTAYGIRANFFHIPLLFIMAQVLDREDLIGYAKWIVLLSIPMTALVALQFLSPPGAWVNIGIGGEGTASFDGAGGRMRASGTFSFINGLVAFYTLAFACWMALIFDRTPISWVLFGIAGMAILLAIPLSISRALLISVAVIAAGAALVVFKLPGWGKTIPRLLLLFVVAATGASQLPIFDEALVIFNERWEMSAAHSGGVEEAIVGRIWQDIVGPFKNFNRTGLLGNGAGGGTMVGAQFLSGTRTFSGGEGEWWRLLWELGFILGTICILYRVNLTLRLGLYGWRKLAEGNPLPFMLFFASGPLLFNGQWGQPTVLGFAIFGAGMILASGKARIESNDESNHFSAS